MQSIILYNITNEQLAKILDSGLLKGITYHVTEDPITVGKSKPLTPPFIDEIETGSSLGRILNNQPSLDNRDKEGNGGC